MKCSCPKCSAHLSDDLSEISEKGKSGKCAGCNSSYWIQRESFMLRSYAVDGERYCSQCGEALAQSTYCPGCGALYPDYCIVATKKPAQRTFEKKNISLALPSFGGKSAGRGRKQGGMATNGKSGSGDLRRQVLMVGTAIALIAAISVGILFYVRDRAESKFTNRFVVTLYGIKSGTDHSLRMSALLASGSRLADKDLILLKSVKTENAATLALLSPPPEKFSDAHSRLLQLWATYVKLNELAINSGPTPDVANAAGDLEEQFIKQAKELKAALPPKLLTQLTTMSSRYKNLQFMLE